MKPSANDLCATCGHRRDLHFSAGTAHPGKKRVYMPGVRTVHRFRRSAKPAPDLLCEAVALIEHCEIASVPWCKRARRWLAKVRREKK